MTLTKRSGRRCAIMAVWGVSAQRPEKGLRQAQTRKFTMTGKLRILTGFRARLILLWSALLLATMLLVFAIDLRVENRISRDVESENKQVKEAISKGFGDFAKAL